MTSPQISCKKDMFEEYTTYYDSHPVRVHANLDVVLTAEHIELLRPALVRVRCEVDMSTAETIQEKTAAETPAE